MGNIFTQLNNDSENQLKKEIKILRQELRELKQNNNALSKEERMKQFYQELDDSIDKYVNEMLKDEEINSVIPDYIEKRIYKNVFTLVLKLFKNVTDSTKISILDQEITINLNPKK